MGLGHPRTGPLTTRAQVSWDWYRIHVLFTNTDPISLAIVVAVIPEFPEAAVGA